MRKASTASVGCRWFIVQLPTHLESAFRARCRAAGHMTGDVMRGYIDDYLKGNRRIYIHTLPEGTETVEFKIMLKFQCIDFLRIVCARRKQRTHDVFASFAKAYLDGVLPSEIR